MNPSSPIDRRAGKVRRARRVSRSLSLLALAGALLSTSCSMFGPAAPPKLTVIDHPGRATVNVTDADVGASIVLQPGQELIVRLPLKATEAREWSVVDLKPGVVTQLGTYYDRPQHNLRLDDDAVGSSVWQFRAGAPGVVAMTFELRRVRRLDAPLQTLTFNVSVKAP